MLKTEQNVDADDIKSSVTCGKYPENLFHGISAPKLKIFTSGDKYPER
ncbi:hypothetical protein [Burkholderia gladioli]|nr:hypothetical protein [Burkholderia gladioli]